MDGAFWTNLVFWLALATFLLALATVWLGIENRRLVKQNRIAVWRPYYAELIACVVDPLSGAAQTLAQTHESRNYPWERLHEKEIDKMVPKLDDASLFESESPYFRLPRLDFDLESRASNLNKRRYNDFKQDHDRLAESINKYNEDAKHLGGVLLALARELLAPEVELKVKVRASTGDEEKLQLNTLRCAEAIWKALLQERELEGPAQIRQFITEHGPSLMQRLYTIDRVMDKRQKAWQQADDLARQLNRIEIELRAVRDSYTRDFAITDDMVATVRDELKERLSKG